jgi:hypothetical protein
MPVDCFLLIHSCIASAFLFAIYNYSLHWKKPFKFLLIPSTIFWITWVVVAISLQYPNSSELEYWTKTLTISGVFFGFVALMGFSRVEMTKDIDNFKNKLRELKNKLRGRKQP